MSKRILIFLSVLLLLTSVVFVAQEGYDPMIQITKQFAHPNLLLVIDVTGSMAWAPTGNTYVGVDSTGIPVWRVQRGKRRTSPCLSNQYKYVATLTPGKPPSRMAMIKNALGNSVKLYSFNPSGVDWSTVPVASGWTYMGLSGGNPQWYKCASRNPGVPFVIDDTTPGVTVSQPKDLIGQTKNQVNWAVTIFSSRYGDCTENYGATVKTTWDLTESGDVTQIENLFKLYSQGGLGARGATSTRGAIAHAKQFIQASILGTKYYDYTKRSGSPQPLPEDTKFFTCGRTYGVILVTDGLSNSCNQNDSVYFYYNWINPCGSAPYACDGYAGSYDCDRRYGRNRGFTYYPPGRIDDLYQLTVTKNGQNYRVNTRTWVIGVSDSINPCELNFDAYIGRTDASAPNGDTGFDISKDLDRLPNMNTVVDPNTGKVIAYTTLRDNEETVSHYNNNDPRYTGKHYAFFATNAEAFADAIAAIVAGVAVGDYTTSSPVASQSASATGTDVFLTSADFPNWKGHLYCYDAENDPAVLRYDAGEKLTSQPDNKRKIYTWDILGNLVEITSSNLVQLKAIAFSFTPSFDPNLLTSNVIDFIRGNDGGGVARSWKLGPIINSTPAIIGPPTTYKKTSIDGRADFETFYAQREPLIYIGSDDGMLHCFLLKDHTQDPIGLDAGNELFAVLPPNLLAKQVDLYNNFLAGNSPTGQPKQPKDHIYGVASSPRYGDVYFGSGVWKTLLFLTEGPGGELIAALDVTDPYGKMTSATPEPPFSVVWYHTSQDVPELKKTWSVPAVAMKDSTNMFGVVGSGYDEISATTSPYILVFDPKNGTLLKKYLTSQSGSYVRNQAFANSIAFQTTTDSYAGDNFADLGLQADLNGQLWFYNVATSNSSVGINVGSKQPIYYSPAVSGYSKGSNTYDIYVFASGTPYEKDPDITGSNVGNINYFIPSIYVGVKKDWGPNNTTLNLTQLKIQDLTWEDGNGNLNNFGKRTQVTTSPLLIVPKNNSGGSIQALFAVYDPDTTDCAGTSYIITLDITVSESGNATVSHSGSSAGSGASSGFAVVGKFVVVAKSGIGEGQRATISRVPGVTPKTNTGTPTPTIWRELQ